MRSLYCIFLFLCCFSVSAADLKVCRQLFLESATNERAARIFLLYTANSGNTESATEQGYRAAARFLWCNYESNPLKKLRSFQEGRRLLEVAITSEPMNTELRYLRMAIQINLPGMLGYDGNITGDKHALEEYLLLKHTLQDPDLVPRIKMVLDAYHKQKNLKK